MSLGELHEQSLAPTLIRRFQSIEEAVRCAAIQGWPVRVLHRPLSRAETIAELQRRHREGRSVYKSALEVEDNRLWNSARRHFGDLVAAREAAGLADVVPARQRWSRDEILAALRRRKLSGRPLNAAAVQDEEGGLYAAALVEFGSYMAAAERFGAEAAQRSWTRDGVIDALRCLARGRRGPLLATEVPPDLLHACRRYFGGYRAARDTAGVPGLTRTWTADEVLEALRAGMASGARPTASSVGSSLATAAWRHFGGFQAALAAAAGRPREAAESEG